MESSLALDRQGPIGLGDLVLRQRFLGRPGQHLTGGGREVRGMAGAVDGLLGDRLDLSALVSAHGGESEELPLLLLAHDIGVLDDHGSSDGHLRRMKNHVLLRIPILLPVCSDSSSPDEHAEVTAAEEPRTATVPARPAVLITPRRDGLSGALRRAVSGLLGLVSIGICSFSRVRTIHHADTRSWISGFQRTIAHGSTRTAASANAQGRERSTETVSDETADRGQPRAATGWRLAASAYVFTVVMMGTTLPTPLYPLYEERFGFGTAFTTQLFAIYA